jgi:hypothetical protein
MDRPNEDPAGAHHRGANTNSTTNGHTHSNGSGGAQGHPKGATGYNWRQFAFTAEELRGSSLRSRLSFLA